MWFHNCHAMLITGIRQKLNVEFNTHRSALVSRYLIHIFQMFAFLGIIFPVLIVYDYVSEKQKDNEILRDKYYKLMDNLNQIEYCFFTDTYQFYSDKTFFEHANKDDMITLFRTTIFKTVTNVSYSNNGSVYSYKPCSIYGWPIVVTFITFVCSVIMIILTSAWVRKTKNVKYERMLNLGILNSISCLVTIVATLFHLPY